MKLLSGAVCHLRKRENINVFWKWEGACCALSPVYHTYFYTKYFNNVICKSRSSPFSGGPPIDRIRHTNLLL